MEINKNDQANGAKKLKADTSFLKDVHLDEKNSESAIGEILNMKLLRAKALQKGAALPDEFLLLSDRFQETILWIGRDLNTEQVAEKLFVTKKTVYNYKNQMAHILDKHGHGEIDKYARKTVNIFSSIIIFKEP